MITVKAILIIWIIIEQIKLKIYKIFKFYQIFKRYCIWSIRFFNTSKMLHSQFLILFVWPEITFWVNRFVVKFMKHFDCPDVKEHLILSYTHKDGWFQIKISYFWRKILPNQRDHHMRLNNLISYQYLELIEFLNQSMSTTLWHEIFHNWNEIIIYYYIRNIAKLLIWY